MRCTHSCTPHGVCDPIHDICNCEPGWTGRSCRTPAFPSCRLGAGATHHIPCQSIRRVSPMACECLIECLSQHEICAPGSFGCERPWDARLRDNSTAARMRHRPSFHDALPCIYPVAFELPLPEGSRLTTLGAYQRRGEDARDSVANRTHLTPFEAGLRVPTLPRSGGNERLPAGALFVATTRCGTCNGRGRCLQPPSSPVRCLCAEGAHGSHCEHVCTNDCQNHCTGHGECIHGWCRCEAGWFGVDCSDAAVEATTFTPHRDVGLHGDRPEPSIRLHRLPPLVKRHAEEARSAVFVYDLPHAINRYTEMWMAKQWGKDSLIACSAVHERRIYSGPAHFEARLFHDRFVRTRDPDAARLFYVPVFLTQRFTWDAEVRRPMLKVLRYIRTTFPYWNRSAGVDHVWFVPGERSTCKVPLKIAGHSIIIGLWGDTNCVDPRKDVIVPPLSPMQHDRKQYVRRFQRPMLLSSNASFGRSGPLLFFAGGIFSFGASQDNLRKTGRDSADKIAKWTLRVQHMRCAEANVSCRNVYSMGVRQALWKYGLHRDPDARIVSAGVPDYVDAVRTARYCLHTEGNGWGTRLVDYMAFECLPVIVNDGMLLPFHGLVPYDAFALRASKRQIPQLMDILRKQDRKREDERHAVLRAHKRAFVWWSDEGLAYEYTIAALMARHASLEPDRPQQVRLARTQKNGVKD